MLNVDQVYVVHYTKLKERRNRLESFLENNNISAEWITEYDKDNLTTELIEKYYEDDPGIYNATIDPLYKFTGIPYRKINLAEISCTIKHYEAIKKIDLYCKNLGIIIEDDIIPVDNFVDLFNDFLNKTPQDWEAIFIGGCCNLRIPSHEQKSGQIAYLKGHPSSKCGDGYVLRAHLAKKIANTMMPFHTISDWELGYQLYLHNAKVYWWEPPIISQGSETGLFKSELR